MSDIAALVAQANARGSTSAFADMLVEAKLPTDVDRAKAKIFQPLRLGSLSLQHRIVHPGLGRSRSDFGAESPLAAKYFAQRTTPGSLVISQATGVSADAVAWQWAASLYNDTQQAALVPVIQAVHDRGGFWFQQLFHVGRCTTPALVKLSRERAGLSPPEYGFRPMSSSAVAETGLNTHSGEVPGVPHALTIEEIKIVQEDFKKAAQRAVAAGADGIEILGGNGWLIDQFLHDNINIRTDEYGQTIENRSRFALEVVEAIAEVMGLNHWNRYYISAITWSFAESLICISHEDLSQEISVLSRISTV
ncbi:12-oxophytodienoate reductase [Hyaloscypha variabilis F]|uniref:12-oxophytodienoate reductase n=1 Tax=Hyaloscypha variabilis (strain UAMH 11265 / GT02V1 / F) TaxID=1149755 RepID=A0A2J6QUB1_HYAVF|nr:12-oxophytodienoate reductase [Hyaloscypha variabilis F]